MINNTYSVKQLAQLAGVSVRTLHLYDQCDLLKPAGRTDAGYRKYDESALLRLQQILFYKELDLPLKAIAVILDNPGFDLQKALEGHKAAIQERRNRLNTLLKTIDKTIAHLKHQTMSAFEELYEGLPKEQAMAWRDEAITQWGAETVLRAEHALKELSETDLERLKTQQVLIMKHLKALSGADPHSEAVQEQIARHYANIRSFWGIAGPTDLRADIYRGLSELYVTDERYLGSDGHADHDFAAFMRKAMTCFADRKLV
jgi:DNA-binding transcriptional MerR regulator